MGCDLLVMKIATVQPVCLIICGKETRLYRVTRNNFAISKAYEWPAALGDALQTLVFSQPGPGDSLHETWTASNFHLQNQPFWCPKTVATLTGAGVVCARGERGPCGVSCSHPCAAAARALPDAARPWLQLWRSYRKI